MYVLIVLGLQLTLALPPTHPPPPTGVQFLQCVFPPDYADSLLYGACSFNSLQHGHLLHNTNVRYVRACMKVWIGECVCILYVRTYVYTGCIVTHTYVHVLFVLYGVCLYVRMYVRTYGAYVRVCITYAVCTVRMYVVTYIYLQYRTYVLYMNIFSVCFLTTIWIEIQL